MVDLKTSRIVRLFYGLALASVTAAALLHGRTPVSECTLKQILSISADDLPGNYNGVLPEAFDIAPDGKTIAVEFEAGEGQGVIGIWVGEWDIAHKKLVAHARVEGPLTGAGARNPQFIRDLRFTPDGRELVAQTGPRVRVLDANTLKSLYSISPLDESDQTATVFVRHFAISGDGRALAVLSSDLPFSGTPPEVRLFSLSTGKRISESSFPPMRGIVAPGMQLSFSGDRILMTLGGSEDSGAADVLLVDSSTGKVLRSFSSGFGHGAGFGAWNALFLGNDRFVVSPGPSSDASGHYSGDALKVFDAQTGQVVHQFTYKPFGPTGVLALAGGAPVLATISYWQSPTEIRSDWAVRRAVPKLLLFHLEEEQPFCVLDRVRPGQPVSSTAVPRLSADGSMVATLQGSTVKVHEVANPGLTALAKGKRSP